MKTMKLLFTLLFVAAFASVGFGQTLDGSSHDFVGLAWNTTGEMCIVCHAPHNNINVTDELLWNHTVTEASYIPYDSPTMDATMLATVSGPTKLCLTCHDGTIGLQQFGGNGAGTPTNMTGTALFGTDLSNDHPVSIQYIEGTAADMNLGTFTTAIGNSIEEDLLYDINGDGTVFTVECSSCHDVHDAYGYVNLLKIQNTNSALCTTCHLK